MCPNHIIWDQLKHIEISNKTITFTRRMDQKPQNKKHRNVPQNTTTGHNELSKVAS